MLPRSMRRFITRRLGIDALRAEHAADRAALQAQYLAIEQQEAVAEELRRQLRATTAEVQRRIDQLESEQRASATAHAVSWATLWNSIESGLDTGVVAGVVSVVLPTRNRVDLLRRAVGSVLGQKGVELELVVVDDGSTDATAQFLHSLGDARVTVLDGDGQGAAAARNLALAHARGSVVAFADDDNVMAPGWLVAAARHLEGHPAAAGVYGAQLREPEEGGQVGLLYREPFDRAAMLRGPYIDLGATAFRAGIDGLHFDTALTALLDWDMLIRVTATGRLDAIPVLAGLYTTSAPQRITNRDDKAEALSTVRARAAAELDDS